MPTRDDSKNFTLPDNAAIAAAVTSSHLALQDYLRPPEQAIQAMRDLGMDVAQPALYAEIDRLRAELAEARTQLEKEKQRSKQLELALCQATLYSGKGKYTLCPDDNY